MKVAIEVILILAALAAGVYFAAKIRGFLKAKRTAAAQALKAAANKAIDKL